MYHPYNREKCSLLQPPLGERKHWHSASNEGNTTKAQKWTWWGSLPLSSFVSSPRALLQMHWNTKGASMACKHGWVRTCVLALALSTIYQTAVWIILPNKNNLIQHKMPVKPITGTYLQSRKLNRALAPWKHPETKLINSIQHTSQLTYKGKKE